MLPSHDFLGDILSNNLCFPSNEPMHLSTYPSVDWKGVMGVRDIIAHHYFEVNPEAVLDIIKNDLEPLKKAIDFFEDKLFPEKLQ